MSHSEQGDQPKPTGEWTASPIGEILHNGEVMATAFTYVQGKACVDAINAALAAEREKVQTLVDALRWMADGHCVDMFHVKRNADAALAQWKEKP